ncbi:MAG TPA: DUF445 domain-containing protein [Methylomirabilota bacterium]|nr:DUF445 domain-containing protein [Methylomirabilota bacterium]
MRTKRRLALAVLLAAVGLAAAAFPFRATWWGGWILAIAEAGIVGGLADWFAVTAIFRRPLGLPIPHTGLIPRNWELLAARVGTMVGDRVLTREYLAHELARLDLADLAARAAERLSRADLESATRAVLGWAVRAVPVESTGEITGRLQRLLVAQPVAPMLARGLELARQHGWDQRAVGGAARAAGEAMDRPELRRAVEELVDEVLSRYRERMPLYPRLALGLADVLGLINRERVVGALRSGLEDVARDPAHPLRARVGEAIDALAARLRHDPAAAARAETVKAEMLGSPVVTRLAEDAARAVRRALLDDLERPQSEALGWLVDRLERWRRTLVADGELRRELDRWVKQRAQELVDRHHGLIAAFIEKGVHALGPEGAVRLIEEHAGDDLQYIRVNGTVVGGLAGGLLYAIHLIIKSAW